LKKSAGDAGDAVEGMGGPILAAAAAVAGLAKGLSKAFMANKNFSDAWGKLKSMMGNAFTAAVKPVSDFFARLINNMVESTQRAKALQDGLSHIGDGANSETGVTGAIAALEKLNGAIDEQKKKIAELQAQNGQYVEDVATGYGHIVDNSAKLSEAENNLQALENRQEKLTNATKGFTAESGKAYDAYTKTINGTMALQQKGAVTTQQANQTMLTAAQNYVAVLKSEYSALVQNGKANSAGANAMLEKIKVQNDYINGLSKEINTQKTNTDTLTRQQQITKARVEAEKEYQQAAAEAAKEASDGLITEKEKQSQITESRQQEYAALNKIVAAYKLRTGATVDLLASVGKELSAEQKVAALQKTNAAFNQQVASMQNDIADKEAQQNIDKIKAQNKNKEAIAAQNALIDTQRSQQWDIEKSQLKQNGYTDTQIAQIKTLYDEQTKLSHATDDTTKATADYGAALSQAGQQIGGTFGSIGSTIGASVSAFQKAGGDTTKETAAVMQGVAGMTSTIGDAMVSDMQSKAQDAIAEVQAQLQEQEDAIEAARQEALEEAGFNQDETEQGLEEQVEAAQDSGDKVLEYQKKRQLEEKKINDKYDAQKTAAEQSAAQQQAQIQYQTDLASWKNQVIQSIANTAAAVVETIAQWGLPWGLIPAGVASAMGAAQTAIISANPPQKPAFATGGIVPGNSYSGDNVAIQANSGEGVFTQDQMAALAPVGSTVGNITLVVQMDGLEMARAVVPHIDSGEVTIAMRGIKGL
jgi:hypothetical protein